MEAERQELKRLLSDIADRERKARRRAVVYTVVPALVGLLLLGAATYRASTAEQRRQVAIKAALDAEEQSKRAKEEAEQARKTLTEAQQALAEVAAKMGDIAAGTGGDPRQLARDGLEIVRRSPVGPRVVATPVPTTAPVVRGDPSVPGRWAVVAGGSSNLDGARERVRQAPALGYQNISIYHRDNYRTVIEFDGRAAAVAQLQAVRRSLDPGAYVRDLNVWCRGPAPGDGFTRCQ